MTFITAVGHFNNSTTGTTDTISSLSFKPKALIMWAGSQHTVGWANQNSYFGVGFTAANGSGPAMQYGAMCSTNNSASYAHRNTSSGAFALYLTDYNNAVLLEVTAIGFTDTGFTTTYSTTPPVAYTIYYLAIGGTDVSAGVTQWTEKTTVGDSVVTLTGTTFQPSCVFHLFTGNYHALPNSGSDSGALSFGAMDAAGNQFVQHINGTYAGTSSTWSEQITSQCMINGAANGTLSNAAAYKSMNSNGFTVTWGTVNTNANYVFSLALTGGDYQVGVWNKSTAAATVTDTVPVANLATPSAVLATTDSFAASANAQAGMRFTMGASDGTNNGVLAMTSINNKASPQTASYNYNDITNSIIVAQDDTGTTQAAASIGSFAAQSFGAAWTTNNAVATQICYIAMGSGAVNAAWTETTVPTCTTDATATVVPGTGFTEVVVPTCTTEATSKATASAISAYTLITTPTCTTDATVTATVGVGSTEVTVPDCTTSAIAPTLDLQVTQTTTPACDTVVITPTLKITDVDGAIVTNCQVEFISFPNTSTITNIGQAGAAYDGVISGGTVGTTSSGAPCLHFAGYPTSPTDCVTIPHGPAIDNHGAITIEMIVYYKTAPSDNTWPGLWDKSPGDTSMHSLGIGNDSPPDIVTNVLDFDTHMYNGDGDITRLELDSAEDSFLPSRYHFIQLTYDRSDPTNSESYAVVRVNGSDPITLTDWGGWSNGGPATIIDDSGVDITLLNHGINTSINNYGFCGDLILYRQHNVILTDEEQEINYLASRWRKNINCAESTPTCATTIVHSTPGIAVSQITPDCTTGATSTAAPGTGVTETTVPTCTTDATLTATSSGVSAYTLTVVPTANAYRQCVNLSLSVGFIQTTTPSSNTDATTAVVPGIGFTETVVPTSTTIATATTAPNIGFTETVSPTSTTDATATTTLGVGVTETVVPTANAYRQCVNLSEGWAQTTTPECTTTTVTPLINVGIGVTIPGCTTWISPEVGVVTVSNCDYQLVTVPDCTTDATSTVTPWIGSEGGWTQTIIPECTTSAMSTATAGIMFTEVGPPACTTVTIAPAPDLGVQQVTPLGCTTVITTPAIYLTSGITLTTTPGCTTLAIAPGEGEVWIQGGPPGCTTTTLVPTGGIAFTQTASLACMTITPTLSTIGINQTQTITPTCTTDITSPTVGIISTVEFVQTVVPSVTTTIPGVALGVGVTETTVPTAATTGISAPTVGSAWVQTIVPITTTSTPMITTFLGYTMSVTPTGTTSSNVPTHSVSPTIVTPNSTAASLSLTGVWGSSSIMISCPVCTTGTFETIMGVEFELSVPTATGTSTVTATGIVKFIWVKGDKELKYHVFGSKGLVYVTAGDKQLEFNETGDKKLEYATCGELT